MQQKLSSSRNSSWLHLVLIRKSTVLKVHKGLLSDCLTQTQGSDSGQNLAVAALEIHAWGSLPPCVPQQPGLDTLNFTLDCLKMAPGTRGVCVSVARRGRAGLATRPFSNFWTIPRAAAGPLREVSLCEPQPSSSQSLLVLSRSTPQLINTVSTQLWETTLRKRNSSLFSSSH